MATMDPSVFAEMERLRTENAKLKSEKDDIVGPVVIVGLLFLFFISVTTVIGHGVRIERLEKHTKVPVHVEEERK